MWGVGPGRRGGVWGVGWMAGPGPGMWVKR